MESQSCSTTLSILMKEDWWDPLQVRGTMVGRWRSLEWSTPCAVVGAAEGSTTPGTIPAPIPKGAGQERRCSCCCCLLYWSSPLTTTALEFLLALRTSMLHMRSSRRARTWYQRWRLMVRMPSRSISSMTFLVASLHLERWVRSWVASSSPSSPHRPVVMTETTSLSREGSTTEEKV